ncbi:MAG: hypothetical protein Q8O00_09165, partial [Holophaga sp.]|nr:hypothetical protein [Holophaga sp.]
PLAIREVIQAPGNPESMARLLAQLASCRGAVAEAHGHLDESGVSTDLAFRMDLLEIKLGRIQTLLDYHRGQKPGLQLAAEMVEGSAKQHRLLPLLQASLRRLALKVVEHTGHTGEHYLVRDSREYWVMARAAAGGGALTAFTTLLKFILGGLGLAPGLYGLAGTVNYAGSFITMQFLHFSLASKQPAATAAALSATLERSDGMEQEVDLIATITRGQVVATLGNLLLAVPMALVVDGCWRVATGHSFLNQETAMQTLESLHPFRSWTPLFASITGVILWMGSLAGGWASNWSAFRGLPEAVAQSLRFHRLFGIRRAESLGKALDTHFPGVVACLALGLLLAFVPVISDFVGLPVEVRHVTLSAASAAFAMGSGLGTGAIPWVALFWAMVGVLFIGFLNFSVSFALSLRLAIQARNLPAGGRRELLKALLTVFIHNPGRFLLPPKK